MVTNPRRRNENEREDPNSIFDDLFSRSFSATLYIIDTSLSSSNSSFNQLMPIFVITESFLGSPRSTDLMGSFSSFFKEFLLSVRRKEKMVRRLKIDAGLRYRANLELDDCTVCLTNYKIGERIRRLECEHIFHKRCIDRWLLKGDSCCPICRKEPYEEIDS